MVPSYVGPVSLRVYVVVVLPYPGLSFACQSVQCLFFLAIHLTLIQMAGGVYDYQNCEQIWFKMAWSKTKFIQDLNLTKRVSVPVFFIILFQAIFQSKCKSFHLFAMVFCVFPTAGTPKQSIGVWWGTGSFTGSPPYFLLVAWESYMTPSRMAMHFLSNPD